MIGKHRLQLQGNLFNSRWLGCTLMDNKLSNSLNFTVVGLLQRRKGNNLFHHNQKCRHYTQLLSNSNNRLSKIKNWPLEAANNRDGNQHKHHPVVSIIKFSSSNRNLIIMVISQHLYKCNIIDPYVVGSLIFLVVLYFFNLPTQI